MHEVEKFILEEIEKNQGSDLRVLIENLDPTKKRLAMFVAICSKKDVWLKKMIKELSSKTAEIDNFIERIRKYIPIGEVEKKSFGEVFTPFELINEMLDTLPLEVWSDPKLKWGDFCNGVGNFMVIVIKRLMKGLETWEPDEDKRYKHIIENMIYVAELQIKNMFVWMVSVDPKNQYNLNLYRGNSLEEDFDKHMKDVWKVEKMNIIIGNPPYQTENKSTITKTTSNVKLWRIFIECSLSKLNENGYLCYVTPSSWASGTKNPHNSTNLFNDIFKKLNTIIISFDVNPYFKGIGVNFSYFLIQNKKYENKTKIISDNNISITDLSSYKLLPNIINQNIFNILLKINKVPKFDFKMDRKDHYKESLYKEKTKEHDIPVYCGVSKGIFYSDKKSPYFNLSKIFTHRISTLKMISDQFGDYSTNYSQVYLLKKDENADNASNLFGTKFYSFIYKLFQYTQYNESLNLNQLPKVDLSKSWTDEELYNFFELSQEEINLIENDKK